jgi:hypothetical protein
MKISMKVLLLCVTFLFTIFLTPFGLSDEEIISHGNSNIVSIYDMDEKGHLIIDRADCKTDKDYQKALNQAFNNPNVISL